MTSHSFGIRFILLVLLTDFRFLYSTADHCDVTNENGACADEADEPVMSRYQGLNHRCRERIPDFETLAVTNEKWSPVTHRAVSVFSAFEEHRTNAKGPSVRILASGLQEEFNEIGDLYCLLWDEVSSGIGPLSVAAEYQRIYPSTMHADMWVSHFIICPLEADLKYPETVSITATPCDQASNRLNVLKTEPELMRRGTHALCFPAFHSKFADWLMLVEMIEIHRILGVSEILLYNQSVSQKTSDVMRYYEGERYDVDEAGEIQFKVTIIQWHYDPNNLNSYFLQRGAINDCFYRAGTRHQYVTISDLDEVIVPREVTSWPEMMQSLAADNRGAFLFQHAYFRRNKTDENALYLVTQESRWRTDKVVPAGKIRCKSIYDFNKAIKLDIHFPYQLAPGYKEHVVDPDVAILHHYRTKPMASFVQHPENYHYIEDNIMLRYNQELYSRVDNVVSHLKEANIV